MKKLYSSLKLNTIPTNNLNSFQINTNINIYKISSKYRSTLNQNNNTINYNYNFYYTSKKFYERTQYFTHKDIKDKVNKTWSEKKDTKPNTNQEDLKQDFIKPRGKQRRSPVDDEYKEFIDKYTKFVSDREKRRLNFNRKDRWKQREMDDIFKNFDVKKAKFRDYTKLSQELQIVNKKSMNSIEEVYYYLENVFKDGN